MTIPPSGEPASQDVETVFRRLFPHYVGPIHRGLTANEVPGWDSLSHAELIMSLEEVYGVLIDPATAFDYPDLDALLQDLEKLKEQEA